MESLLLFLGGLAGICLLILYSSFSRGWVLYKFYYWFALPVFDTLPRIGFLEAVGLMFLVNLTHNSSSDEKYLGDRKIESKTNWIAEVIKPWIVLVIGWFVHLFL